MSRKKTFTDKDLKRIAENYHLALTVAPVLAGVFVYITRSDIHLLVELLVVAVVVAVNVYILLRRSKTKDNKELSLFYTFRTNDLPPPKTGGQQKYNVKVAVVEDKDDGYFASDVQDRFLKEFDIEKLKSLLSNEGWLNSSILREQRLETLFSEVGDRNLTFKRVPVGHSDKADAQKALEEFRDWLDSELDGSKAVVVLRTDGLDAKPWVYPAVVEWAYENSEFPILFAKNGDKKFPDNTDADQFLWIPDDARKLPWHFLRRATKRGESWHTQAIYNGAMVWNLFYILLLCVYIALIWVGVSNGAYDVAMRGMDTATQTEKSFRTFASIKEDPTLSVSYWFMHKSWFWPEKNPYIFVTTELEPSTTHFEGVGDTVIGCGFAHPNIILEGRLGAETVVYSNYASERWDVIKCPEMRKLPNSENTSIVCATYNDEPDNPSAAYRTVGVCVFTQKKDNNIFSEQGREYVRGKAKEFYNGYRYEIEGGSLPSLEERKRRKLSL